MRATACFIHGFGEKIHIVLAIREDLVADTCLLNKIVCTHTHTHHLPKKQYKAIKSNFYKSAIILYLRALKYTTMAMYIDLTVFCIDKRVYYVSY